MIWVFLPRTDLRVLASRGTSGIDGTTSSAIGAALAHGGPAFALIGDLAFLHDAAGLVLGPDEPRPDLCLVVVNNDGGGIFSTLEQAAFPGSFERLFGTPHGTELHHLAAAFGLPYQRLEQPGDLTKALQGTGLRIVEAQTGRAAGAELRARLRSVAAEAVRRRSLAVIENPGGPALPAAEVEPGEDYLLDAVLRIPLLTAGFRYQRSHPFGLDRDHLYAWIEGGPYAGSRPHASAALSFCPAEEAAGRLLEHGEPVLAAAVRAAADSYRTLDGTASVSRRPVRPSRAPWPCAGSAGTRTMAAARPRGR